ncbi:MAG TPA: hypothetical protein VF773_02245 [Verrucomicrobiae bacterium]
MNISELDAALEFTSGNFIAAAKLMDLTPYQLKSIVQYRPALHRWKKSRRGRPAERLGFRIKEYEPPVASSPAQILAQMRLLELVTRLGEERARQLLDDACRGSETKPDR